MQGIVEVKPQGVSKGGMVEAIMNDAAHSGRAPDWVLCIGDDRSDEDMFKAIEHVTFSPHLPAEVRCSGSPTLLGDKVPGTTIPPSIPLQQQHRVVFTDRQTRTFLAIDAVSKSVQDLHDIFRPL